MVYSFLPFAGFDPELLAFVPRPVAAIIFLYPITEASETYRLEEEARLTKKEQDISPNVMFFKQTISNACGMMALIHSLANNQALVGKCQPLTRDLLTRPTIIHNLTLRQDLDCFMISYRKQNTWIPMNVQGYSKTANNLPVYMRQVHKRVKLK